MPQTRRLTIGLNAVLTSLGEGTPLVLCVERDGVWGLPFGLFDPTRHRTFELALRDFVDTQTAVPLGYVEQLYTFGDMGRGEAPQPATDGSTDRIVSVGYLGLAPDAAATPRADTAWHSWYDYFPWEDWREGPPQSLTDSVLPNLRDWAGQDPDRCARLRVAFGLDDVGWEEERTLDRYELMYEAGLVGEAVRDGKSRAAIEPGSGRIMSSDHRRILATAIGRLRGKLRYRPVIFQMMEDRFTLTELQEAVEAILGFSVHKQNFRRSIESAGLVLKTEEVTAGTGGRPAAIYAPSPQAKDKNAAGLTLPRLRETL
ncbi:MAG: NUDIX hydrolase [Parvularcula sp.]